MAKTLTVSCFGPPRITLGEEVLGNLLTPKAVALLCYLIVAEPFHTRHDLAHLLWSELSSKHARANLRYILPDLRQRVGGYLLITPQQVGFNRQAPYWLDVEVFQTTLTAQTIATPALQTALDLYQGEFLAGFTVRDAPFFEEWVVQQRETLHSLALEGFYTLAERYQHVGNFHAALATTQRLLNWEPWHEAGHRLQMQLLASNGQRSAALAQYALCRSLLADELGVEPEAATIAIYEQIRSGAYDKLTPGWVQPGNGEANTLWGGKGAVLKTSQLDDQVTVNPTRPQAVLPDPVQPVILTLPHNLPSQLTPFFGREVDIDQISSLLSNDSYRLLTLVGEGGSGKTRLALAVAQRTIEVESSYDKNQKPKIKNQFQDGVWFVGLSAITTTDNLIDQLAVAVAQALGLPFGDNQPLFTQLLAYLQSKALLLLFDNAEHLLPEVADFLIRLLQASPSITVLVTSRHLLGVQAEFIWRVNGLALPPTVDLPPALLLTYSSIALFIERASHFHRNFSITAENRAALVAICRLVEGIPLAIELAAALTKQYGCAELYTALQRDYTILATNLRDLPPRHRSIKAMLDHSWRLLSPTEAQILAACAVFPGSFDLAAAAAVTGAKLASITLFIDQSLLHEVQEVTGSRRYILHPLVRHYAAEQLQCQPAVANHVHSQHCAYYVALLIEQSDMLVREPTTLQILQTEIDNLRAAWTWAITQGQFDQVQQSSRPLAQFYKMTGFYKEAEAAFQQAADHITPRIAETAPLPPDRARLLAIVQVEQAYFCARLAQTDKAEVLAQATLAVAVALRDEMLEAQSYLCLAMSRTQRPDYTGARAAAEAAAAAAQRAALPDLEAWSIQNIAITYLADGNSTQGLIRLHQALKIAQTSRDRYLEALIRGSLGSGYYIAGDFDCAHRYLQQARQSSQAMKLSRLSIVALSWLSSLYIQLGLYDLAADDALEAQKGAKQLERHKVEIEACALFALAKYYQGDLVAANYHCQAALQLATEHHLARYTALAQLLQGHLLEAQGQWQAASGAYAGARQVQVTHTQPLWNLRAQAGLALCRLRIGALPQALAQVNELLPLLAERGEGGGMNVYETILISYEILKAAADPRAGALLQQGYGMLQEQAARFADDALRHAFLEGVAANRTLFALGAAQNLC